MKIRWTIWTDSVVGKLDHKHSIETSEVEEVLEASPHIRRASKGHVRGEDVYAAYGQTQAGRYVIVFFIHKRPDAALILSARKMSSSEREYYGKRKKRP